MHHHPTPTRADVRGTIPTQTARQAPAGTRVGSAALADVHGRLPVVGSAVR